VKNAARARESRFDETPRAASRNQPLNLMATKTAENVKKVSLILFIILGLTHILTGFLMTENIGLPLTFIVNHIMDIPFAMIALIYGLASIKTGLKDGGNKILNILFIILALLIFAGLVYINVFVPDKLNLTTA
jgi:hypothetical protein